MELIQEFKNYLFSQKKQPSKVTVKNYVADVKKFISWAQTKLNRPFTPHLITKELIQDYKSTQSSTFSASSMDRQMSSLRKFFAFLKLEGKVGANPFEAVTIKQPLQDPWHLKEFKDFLYVYNASHLTIKNYIIDVKQFFAWAEQVVVSTDTYKLSDRNILSKVNDQMIEEYTQRLLHDGNFSPASINRKLSSLRKYLTWAHDQGFLSNGVTTLPANISHSLLIQAGSIEDNTNLGAQALLEGSQQKRGDANETLVSGIAQEWQEGRDPAGAESLSKAPERAPAGGNSLTGPQAMYGFAESGIGEPQHDKRYSKIPPIRLFQKISALASLGLEYAIVIPVAHAVTHLGHRLWILKGKPLFTRTDVKLPEKIQPFKLKVKNISKSFYNPWGISISHYPLHKKVIYHIKYTRPAWYRRYNRLPAARYFNFAILMIFCAMIGFGLYSSFFSNARRNQTLAALPTAPPRVLSFQGRLTDNNDNPITTANTHLRFAIYNDAAASGSALLWQEVQDVNPDTDGDFATILGNKTTIPSTVFAQNNALWLGVTVETTAELTPRQQIATVAFAANSETLQGLPPITAAGAGTQNVVLALDSGGNLGIAASTTFQSTSGTFTISGNTVVLNTNVGTNGNVVLAPDGYGRIDLQKPLQNSTLNNNIPSAAGSVEVDDLLSVLATSSGQSAFTINQSSTGPLISASTSGIAKFTVDNSGNVAAAGNVTGQTIFTGGGTSFYINNSISNLNSLTLASNLTVSGNVASDLIPALPTDTYSLGDSTHEWKNLFVKNLVVNGSAFAQYWQLNSSVLAPGDITNDLAIGGSSTSSAKFQVFATSAGAQPAGTASTSGNLTFNGTTSPAKINLLNGTSLGVYSATSGKGDAGLNSTPTLFVSNAGNVGIANSSPSFSLDVTGNLRVTTAGGLGGALPGATVQGQTSALAVTGYTGLGGLRVNGTDTTNTIYNGTSNIVISRDTGGFLELTQSSTPSIGLLVNTTTGGTGINTDTTGIGNAQLVVNQSNISGLGDIIAASAAGVTKFKVANSGDVTASQFLDLQNPSFFLDPAATGTSLAVAGAIGAGGANPASFTIQSAGNVGPDATNTYDLGSLSLQWRNIFGQHVFANGVELAQYWQRALGALSPLNITDDLLLGATSTASAKFAFMNVASGIPTASISAGTNDATYLTGDGTLATTALQALTLGSSSTGDINVGTPLTTKNITIGGTSQTGTLTLGQSTTSNTINIGNSDTTTGNIQTINIGAGLPSGTGHAAVTIGNTNDASSLRLVAGSGNIVLTGSTLTNYTIGDATSVGAITLGQSTSGQAINIGNATITGPQVIQIANGNSGANSDVDILSGNGTSGLGTLHLADNTRVNTITLGNVAPANARTTTIAGGNQTVNDTVSVLNGNPSAGFQTLSLLSGAPTGGTQTVNILAGTASGGTQNLNLGSATSTTSIKGTNFTSGGVAYATSNTLNFVTGSEGQCLLSHTSAAPSFGLCTFGNTNYWNLQQGALFPINATVDFLVGANNGASSSAKFAVTNLAGVTPSASVSAVTSGGGTGTGITLSGDGSIQSLINGTLTIGGNTTGNIILKPSNGTGTGTVTLSGYTTGIIHSTSGLLTASAVDLASADVTGTLAKANGGTGQSTYTNGDMLYYDSGTSTTALTKLGIGADNSILNVDATTHLPKWTASPTLSSLTVSGTSTFATIASSVAGGSGTHLNPTTNGTLDLGDSTHYFGTIYANNLITPVGNGTQGFWQLTNNVISPVNSFYDLAVGGSATGSATPFQIFGTTVGVNTAGTATSSAGITFRGATQIAQLNGNDLTFKVSAGGDSGLSTVLTVGANKNVTVTNDLAVNGSNLTSTASTFNLFNANVSNLNFAGVVSNLAIARGSSTTTLNGNLVLGTPASSNTISLNSSFISSLVPNTDNTYDIGTNTTFWRNIYANNVFGNAGAGTQGYWQLNSNVLSPAFNWEDLGIGGTGTSSAQFQIFANQFTTNAGTVPAGTASTSGNLAFRGGTSKVNLLNNTSLGFYTSAGGDLGLQATNTPALYISNSGNAGFIGIGTNNPLTALQIAGSASISANITYYGSGTSHTVNILQGGTLNFQRSVGGDSTLTSSLFLNNNGSFGIGTTSPLATLDIRGNLGTTPLASLSGSTSFASLVVNNDGNGDLFTASASSSPRFTIANDGTIKNSLIPNLNNTYNLGSDPSLGGKEWDTLYVRQVVTPTGTVAADYWQLSNTNQLAPINANYDLVIGGNSTASAKFQVFAGSYAGNPAGTASIAGNLTFQGSGNPTKINLLNGTDLGIYTASLGQGDAGLSNTPLFYASSSANRIGIGLSTPQGILDVAGSGYLQPSDLTLGQAQATNLVTNPSFETSGDSGSSITNWTLSASAQLGLLANTATESAIFGGQALRYYNVGPNGTYTATSSCIAVTAGSAYTLSAYIYKVGGFSGNAGIDIQTFTNSACSVGQATAGRVNATATDQWSRVTSTLTSAQMAGINSIEVRFITDGTNSNSRAYADGFQVEQATGATPYFDGSFGPGYTWDGTPNASVSRRKASATLAYHSLNSSGGLGAASRGLYPTLQLDQDGSGNVIAASVSGITKFVLTNAGNVGIGTSAPGNLLTLKSSSSSINPILESQNDLGAQSFFYTGSSGNAAISGKTVLENASNNAILLNPSAGSGVGGVGIGTTTPLTASGLHVEKNSLGNALVLLKQLGSAGDFLVASNSAGTLQFKFDTNGILTANSFLDAQNTNFFLDPAATGNSASVAGSLTFAGVGTAHKINYLDGGTLNFQRSVGGDTGVASTMYLDSTGNVGIGTTNTANALLVASASGILGIQSVGATAGGASSGGGFLTLYPQMPTAADTRLGLIAFGGLTSPTSSPNYGPAIAAFSSQSWSSSVGGGYLAFYTQPNGTSNSGRSERMRIDQAGNVGIGTTNPVNLLHLAATNTDVPQTFEDTSSTTVINNGTTRPATIADDSTTGTITWTSPTNAAISDNSYATAAFTTSGQASHYLKTTLYAFNIPSTATITGVSITVEKSRTGSSGTIVDNHIFLIKGGTIQTATTDKADTVTGWANNSADTLTTYGGSNDLWGNTLTPSDVNNSGFGVAFSAKETVTGTSTAQVDVIQMTIYYTNRYYTAGIENATGNFVLSSSNALGTDDQLALTPTGSLLIGTNSATINSRLSLEDNQRQGSSVTPSFIQTWLTDHSSVSNQLSLGYDYQGNSWVYRETGSSVPITWNFQGGEIFRISTATNASGWLGIGATAPSASSAKLSVSGTQNPWIESTDTDATNGSTVRLGAVSSNLAKEGQLQYADLFRIVGNGTVRVTIASTGNVGVGTNTNDALDTSSKGEIRTLNCVKNSAGTQIAGTCPSDIRLKTNINPLSDVLDKVLALEPVTYNWSANAPKDFAFDPTQTNFGLIAQQVETVLPDLVLENGQDGYKEVRYERLPIYMLEAMREQQAKIASLSGNIKDLALTDAGDIAVNSPTPSADFTIPQYYTLSDALGNPLKQVSAISDAVIANLRVGSVQASQVLTNSLAVATDNVSIAGQSLHDYIVSIVNQVLQTTQGQGTNSPIASVDQLHTNLVSPLASDSAILLDLHNSRIAVKNSTTGATVASIDNAGNATFSGTLTGQNLAVNGDATVSGTLHANRIEANTIAGLQAVVGTLSAQNITNVTNIYMSSGSASQNGENSTTGSGASGNNSSTLLSQSGGYANIASFSAYLSYVPNLHATTAMFDQGLISLGPTTLTDTSVTGTLTVDTNLTIADNSINVLGADLQIQPFKQGGVSFENGLVAINTNGDLTVNGKAIFNGTLYATTISPLAGQDLVVTLGTKATSQYGPGLDPDTTSQHFTIQNASGSGVFAINQLGDIVASGEATISKLNFNPIKPALAVSATEQIATSSAGTAQIGAHQTQLTIDNVHVTASSLIYITPVGQTTTIPYLLRQVAGNSFTVGIQVPQVTPVTFNWLIVN